jgi:hypothetical protein
MIGHVIIGDIAATLVDLAGRGLLQVESTGAGDDWLLTPSAPGEHELTPYEQILLQGLSDPGDASQLTSLAGRFAAVLDKTRAAVIHDAVHHGWLKHLHHAERTPAGQELTHRIRAFQRDLMHRQSERGPAGLDGPLLPYALHFGMISGDEIPLARFAHAWVATFKDLPGWKPAVRPHPDLAARDLEEYKPAPNTALLGSAAAVAWVNDFGPSGL